MTMDNLVKTEPKLQHLIAKLGHSLEEIRVRSLQNILSKLEHGLVHDSDLVHERQLHIRLLEWFNFTTCPMQDLVLGLIHRLSQHPSAAAIYIDVGAIDFLSHLRPNLDKSLHKAVDMILDNLFHMPAYDSNANAHAAECIYNPRSALVQSASAGLYPESLQLEPGGDQSASDLASNNFSSHHDSNAGGYFSTNQRNVKLSIHSSRTHPVLTAKCLKFATFPWIALTPTDRHVLSSTDESVRSKDASMIVSICEFLMDVVFQDFPAEVFLQRPSIVKNLLALLSKSSPASAVLSAVIALRDLSYYLSSRINFYQDPCMFSRKQEFTTMPGSETSSLSRDSNVASTSVDTTQTPSVGGPRHRGDGQDVDTSSSSARSFSPSANGGYVEAIEQTDLDDVHTLQFSQWTVPQFCLHVLDKVVPCLAGPVDEQLALHTFELLHQIVSLLRESVTAAALWDDTSLPARELIDQFVDLLESLSNVIFSHHHSNLSAFIPDADLERHRVMFIGLAVFSAQLLQTFVPLEMALVALPKEFCSMLAIVIMDRSFADAFPDCATTLFEYARVIDADIDTVYSRTTASCHSLVAACEFLTKFNELNDESIPDLLHLAAEAIPSFSLHLCLDVIDSVVSLCSHVCKKSSPSPIVVRDSRVLVLKLLSSDIEAVRNRAYCCILKIVEEALGVGSVTEPTSSCQLGAFFVVDTKVIYQLCAFGLLDKPQVVQEFFIALEIVLIASVVEKILLYLLQSQLLMPSAMWQQLLDAILPILGVVQICSSVESSLGKCVIGMLETDPRVNTGVLPIVARFRGCLRLMLHSDSAVRAIGAEKALKFIAQEKSSLRKLPSLTEVDMCVLNVVFLVKNPRTVSNDNVGAVFQSADVKKVWDIFTNEALDLAVRKSAAEQMAVLVSDASLRSTFRQLGGIGTVLEAMRMSVEIPLDAVVQRNPMTLLLPALMKLLRCLVEKDSSLRHDVAHQLDVYYHVFRAALIHLRDEETRRESAELVALLIFDELATPQEWSDSEKRQSSFSLPACIVQRYNVPLVASTYDKRSTWADDVTQADAVTESARIAWNIAWHDGIESAVKSKDAGTGNDKFNRALALTHVDRVVCSTTHLPYALKLTVYAIENATNHAAVSNALLRLQLYLVAGQPHHVAQHLQNVNWMEAVTRFLSVIPATSADEQLLADIVQFLSVVIERLPPSTHSSVYQWTADMLLDVNGSMYQLLTKQSVTSVKETNDSAVKIRRQFGRLLLKFIRLFVGRYPFSKTVVDSGQRCVHGDLARSVLVKINRVDSIQAYNLPSLEMTLLALMHITARPGWSTSCSSADCLSLCLEMMQTLLEVVSAFHAGRGGLSMSYMGRGITRCAAVCLRHLAHEMATSLHSQEWPRNWLFAKHAATDSVGESGLHWLFPLWTYRDPEVSAQCHEVHLAGISIAAALTSTEAGRITMATQCHNVPGGIWGAALSVLLDLTECSLARQQAALLLVNLTSQSMPSGVDLQSTAAVWQGPVVRNEETGALLIGLEALFVLLKHLQFYDKIREVLSFVYIQPAIHPTISSTLTSQSAVIHATSTTVASQNTVTTSTSATPQGPVLLPNVATATLVDIGLSSQGLFFDDQSSLSRQQNRQSTMLATDHQRHVLGDGDNGENGVDASALGAASLSQASSATGSVAASAANSDVKGSIVTPCFVSAVCRLLSNIIALSPNDVAQQIRVHGVFDALLELLDEKLLHAYVMDLSSTEYRSQFLLTFTDLLSMHSDVIDLTTMCVANDQTARNQLIENRLALKQTVLMLGVKFTDDSDTWEACTTLWNSAILLLSTLLSVANLEAYVAISTVLASRWSVLYGRVCDILQDESLAETKLLTNTLNFIGLLCLEEIRFKAAGFSDDQSSMFFTSNHLDAGAGTSGGGGGSTVVSDGDRLCRILIGLLDVVISKPREQFNVGKMAVFNALKAIIAISVSAKSAALQAGLLETLCDHSRRLHGQLNMDALDMSASSASIKKKSNVTVSELMMTFDLIRNFLFNSEEVKTYACKSSLANIIHCVWSWCQTNAALMSCTLSLLCAYTAHCPPACSSLAFTSASAWTVYDKATVAGKHSNNSMVHCIIRLIQKESSSQASSTGSAFLRLAFTVASTLTISTECRGIMWKSNFLHEFSTLSPQKLKKSKSIDHLKSLWLSLFVNLSFSGEGQSMILKIEDSVSLLIDFANSGVEGHRMSALLILRNLSCHTNSKPKLLANDNLIPLLMQNVESGSSLALSIACSAILALIHNNQKAKGMLKNPLTVRRLREALNRIDGGNVTQLTNSSSGGGGTEGAVVGNCSQTINDILVLLCAA